jgi:hypothetical protein
MGHWLWKASLYLIWDAFGVWVVAMRNLVSFFVLDCGVCVCLFWLVSVWFVVGGFVIV